MVEPMIKYSNSLFGTFLIPRIRFIASPANWPMLTSASADVCHAGKKLLPQVPYGILALGNITIFFFIVIPSPHKAVDRSHSSRLTDRKSDFNIQK
jgi:hypothetical protein